MSQQPSLRQLDPILDSEEIMSMLLLDFDNNNSSTHDFFFDQFLRSQTDLEEIDKPPCMELSSSAQGMNFAEVKVEMGLHGYYNQQQEGLDYQTPMQNQDDIQYTNGMFSASVVEEGSRDDSDNHVSKKGSSKSSKKRPRENLDDLEARVRELQTENADLHAHLLNVTQRTTEVQRQRAEMERQMVMRLSSGRDTDLEELSAIVKKYTDIYADYGKCRQREVSFHLQQLEKLIIPTKTTKMCLWALQQDKSFYQKNKSPMFDILSKELEITPDQAARFQERRDRTLDLLAQLRECLDLLGQLKEAIEQKHNCYDAICGRAQSAASPTQTVKFLMWINKHADDLAKFIPGFSRNTHHTPDVDIVERAMKK